MGDPDLTVAADGEGEQGQPAGGTPDGGSTASGRGLVVFPARRQPARQRPAGHWIAGYLPFLTTVAVGAVVVLIIAFVIGR